MQASFWQLHQQKIFLALLVLLTTFGGFMLGNFFPITQETPLLSPFVDKNLVKKELTLLQYTIPNLKTRRYAPSQITLEKIITENPTHTTYLFSYLSNQQKITGQLNIPQEAIQNPTTPTPVILLIRGYVPLETYQTGAGTQNAAKVFAEAGYITLAPDFLGYGESDPEPTDSWEARFIKPIQIVELVSTLRTQAFLEFSSVETTQKASLDPEKLGIWAHSNGGQIALTSLEILEQAIPTTLWAPVTVPFPYSVLFYTDEMVDEGRATRMWLSEFEKNYDPREFSLTQYLESLIGPIQLHHGTVDEAALKNWSDEFVQKIATINTKREENNQPTIELDYYTYPGADHNMLPVWNTVIQRDLKFFNQEFNKSKL